MKTFVARLKRSETSIRLSMPSQFIPRPTASWIVASHSLIPQALHHAFATFGALMSPELPLSRRQHEMITTVVSVVNRCHY
jgi:alkylhydroperoxidase family enzyme